MKKPTQSKKTEAAFLEAMLSSPLDAIHQRVYADWLDDHADARRAEFVRLAVRRGEPDLGEEEGAALDARLAELKAAPSCDPWWAAKILAPSQLRGLLRLTEARFGPLAELYDKKLYRSRCLHPPTTRKEVLAAERRLKFPLPPLLGLVYACLGNGGLIISALGLRGGQTGFNDVGFEDRDAVTGYEGCVAYGKWVPGTENEFEPWPQGLVPLYDDLGCGMVDYVDCTDPAGPIWRGDSGHYSKWLDSLEAYFRDRLNFWRPPT
jgi:uncharacterized protein (TIGR02996 family)